MKIALTSEQKWIFGALVVVILGAAPSYFMKPSAGGSGAAASSARVGDSGDEVPIVETTWSPRTMTGDEQRVLHETLKIDLNHSDVEQLNGLPNVGASTAQAIVDYRTAHGCFRDVDELQNVKGFGGSKFDVVKDHIRVDVKGCVFKDGGGESSDKPSGRKKSKRGGAADGKPVDINTADEDELDALPGIGKAMARKIIQYREDNGRFSSIDEITNVPGVKESTFEKFKDYITVN